MGQKKKAKKQTGPFRKIVARNKKARHDYFIDDEFEAGLQLLGSEVKSLRMGRASIQEAFVRVRRNEAWLLGFTITEYPWANQFNHLPGRDRKLLLHRAQIDRLEDSMKLDGVSVFPLELYFNEKGKVKVIIGVGRGKKNYDKRQSMREADHKRDIERGYDRGGRR